MPMTTAEAATTKTPTQKNPNSPAGQWNFLSSLISSEPALDLFLTLSPLNSALAAAFAIFPCCNFHTAYHGIAWITTKETDYDGRWTSGYFLTTASERCICTGVWLFCGISAKHISFFLFLAALHCTVAFRLGHGRQQMIDDDRAARALDGHLRGVFFFLIFGV